MSKKHKNDDFCNMSAEEQKRQMMAFEEAFTGGTVGELLDDIENMDDDDRVGDMMLRDTLGKILDGEEDDIDEGEDTADALFPEFEESDDSEGEPIPYSDIAGIQNPSRENFGDTMPTSRALPRFFDIDFMPGTTLIKISDGLKVCTIDYNALEKKPWDAEKVAKHLSRDSVDETQMFITAIHLLLPNFYPAYIGTKDTIRAFMSSIKEFNDDRFIFFTRNFVTAIVPHSEIIVGYDIPEQSMENLLNVAEFLIDNNLHTSFIETLYGIVTMGGFSTNSLQESDLMAIWSTGIFVDSNEAFVEQLLEDENTERCEDSSQIPVELIAYDETEDPSRNYSYMRYVDEAYSPIFAILFDSEADFSEVDSMLNEIADGSVGRPMNAYKVDNVERPDSVFIDDGDEEPEEDYVAENEIIPGGDISEDEDDDPEDILSDEEDFDEDDTPQEMDVKKVPGPQPEEMIVSKDTGIGFNAKKSISDMTDDEIEDKYGDEYADLMEKGNRPAPRQSMKKNNKFDDGDMVVKRR